ncbi:organic cation/carnitine transporter 2-like [Uloborus diversus]|uniref:organic cation/carnitine transporter 2-like n=1 Tax=Uloborus diversus TaxID=327109 RepID=UPI002409F280|nr:organic cation/carnitine transporter 2-like [Uloborus diversus]
MPDWGEASAGKYQILTTFLLCCVQLPITFSDHLLTLYAWAPPHRCRLPPQNETLTVPTLSRPIVERNGRKMFSSCLMYLDPNDHSVGTQSCSHGWEFLHSEEEWTLVTEWNLVCEREYLINLLPYVYTAGTMLGGLLFGVLADHYGRRFNLLAALFLHTFLGLALHFFSLYIFYAVGYALQGILVTAIQCISFTLLLETVSYPYHLKSTFFLSFVTPFGVIVLSIVAWLIKNWRYIQLAISAPGIVCLGYFWLIPRSLPWLLAEGYVAEAEKQLLRFARFNKTLLPHNFRIRLMNFCKAIKSFSQGSHHSLETVVCSAKIRRYTFILYYMWFVSSLESETSSTELPALKNNKYASLFVKGLMDAGMLILLYFFAQRFGPRIAHATFLIFGGTLCIGSAVVGYTYYILFNFFISFSEIIYFSLSLMSPVLSVLGKTCVRSVIATNIFFTIKIFPTGVRAVGLGTCLFWTRAANLLGVHISSLNSNYFFPLAICGTLSLIGGCLTSFLPSNFNRPLPNVALEVEKPMILEASHSRRKRPRHLCIPQQGILASIDTDDFHFEEEQENEKNNTLLELNVQEFQRLPQDPSLGLPHPCDVAGPSRLYCHSPEKSSIIDKEDAESRLTDLEDELSKIWDMNAVREEETLSESLHEFRHGDVKEHYLRMNETRF